MSPDVLGALVASYPGTAPPLLAPSLDPLAAAHNLEEALRAEVAQVALGPGKGGGGGGGGWVR